MKFVAGVWKVARVVILGLIIAGSLLGIVLEIKGRMDRAAAIAEIEENLERELKENRKAMEIHERKYGPRPVGERILESQLRIEKLLRDSDR